MALLNWLLSASLDREKLALLVLCMLVGYVVAANLAWRLFYSRAAASSSILAVAPGRDAAAPGRPAVWRWVTRWVEQAIRLLYYVGVPCAVFARQSGSTAGALFAEAGIPTTWIVHGGGTQPHGGGTQPQSVPWQQLVVDEMFQVDDVGAAAAIWVGGACLFVAVWIWYAWVSSTAKWDSITVNASGMQGSSIAWWQALREALFLQTLWAFYRGSIAMHIADSSRWDSAATVAFLVLALVSVSWLLSPLRRQAARDPARGYQVGRDWMLALLTICTAMTIRSLWLLVLMHWMWLWTGDRVLKRAASPYAEKATLLGGTHHHSG